MTRDLRFFLGAFSLALLATFLPIGLHVFIALALVVLYGWHAWQIIKSSHSSTSAALAHPTQALRLSSREEPLAWLIFAQVGLALLGLILGAHFFVIALTQLTTVIKIPVFILSVIVTPVATELPEVLNSVIWVKRRKDTLAVGNVSGALAFQASVVPALGIGLTSWQLDPWELVTGAVAWLAVLWVWLKGRSRAPKRGELLTAGFLYVLYIALILQNLSR
jgi:cation:H+ antiporter